MTLVFENNPKNLITSEEHSSIVRCHLWYFPVLLICRHKYFIFLSSFIYLFCILFDTCHVYEKKVSLLFHTSLDGTEPFSHRLIIVVY